VNDAWLHTYGTTDPYLTAPLTAVTACRLVRSSGRLIRAEEVDGGGALDEMTRAVNAAHQKAEGEIPFDGCATAAIRTVDVLVLRDVVGQTIEVRVDRDTCPSVAFGFEGAPADATLDAVLDGLLGRPR
jgi:hypothetical protein